MYDILLLAVLFDEALDFAINYRHFFLRHLNKFIDQELLFRDKLLIWNDLSDQGQKVDISGWFEVNLLSDLNHLENQHFQSS